MNLTNLMPVIVGLLFAFSAGAAGLWVITALRRPSARDLQYEAAASATPKRNWLEGLDWQLRQAGIGPHWTPVRFLLASFALGVAGFLFVEIVFGYQLVALLAFVVTGWIVPRWYVSTFAERRVREVTDAVDDAARFLGNSIEQGRNLQEAMADFSRRDNPVAQQFHQVLIELRLYISIDESLRNAAGRLGNRHFDALVTTMIMFRDKSLTSMGKALLSQSDAIRAHLHYIDEQRKAMNGPRGNYMMVGGIALFVGVYSKLTQPQLFDSFYASTLGQAILIGMCVWWYVGYRLLMSQYRKVD